MYLVGGFEGLEKVALVLDLEHDGEEGLFVDFGLGALF